MALQKVLQRLRMNSRFVPDPFSKVGWLRLILACVENNWSLYYTFPQKELLLLLILSAHALVGYSSRLVGHLVIWSFCRSVIHQAFSKARNFSHYQFGKG